MTAAIDGEWKNLPDEEDASFRGSSETVSSSNSRSESRMARWDDDVDPCRAQVLYHLTAAEFEEEHGYAPLFVELNRLFPASAAGPQKSGVWNEIAKGHQLPRNVAAPQALLMRKLSAVYPKAAASYSWPIWALSSWSALTLPQVHGLMLKLPEGIRQMLIGSYRNGRYLRFPTDPRHEVSFMAREKSLDGVTALIALMREAELKQDPLTHGDAYDAMLPHLPVLDAAFGSADLGQGFAAFLKQRFASMEFIVPGAYEAAPGGDGDIAPVRFKLAHRLDHEGALRQHAEWLGLPANTFEAVLQARQRSLSADDGTDEPGAEQGT